MLTSLLLIAALAQAPAPGSELNQGDVAPPADGGMAKTPGPDVNKMPFTPFSIQEVIKYHLPEIQHCYDQVILEIGGAPPEGTVVANFTILENGLTSETKVDRKKTTIKNDRIHDCVTDAVRMWEFPKPNDNRPHPIEYPFNLKVNHEPGEKTAKPADSTDKTDSTAKAPAKTSKKKGKKK